MFNRKAELECHYAEGGRIYCTVRRTELDVDHCFSCPHLLEATKAEDGNLVLRCTKGVDPRPGPTE